MRLGDKSLTQNLHERLERKEELKGSSNRSFGFIFAVFFVLVGTLPVLHHHAYRPWALILAVAIFAVALVIPNILAPLNKLWMQLGLLLSKVMTPIIVGIMFYVFVSPMAMVMRLMGKDPLKLKLSSETSSYWVERTPPGPEPKSLRNQF